MRLSICFVVVQVPGVCSSSLPFFSRSIFLRVYFCTKLGLVQFYRKLSIYLRTLVIEWRGSRCCSYYFFYQIEGQILTLAILNCNIDRII